MSKRALGIDLGARRIGLALSDPAGILARPYKVLTVAPRRALDELAAEIAALAQDDDGLAVIVVGVPLALDGHATDATARARAVIADLRARTPIPVAEADERLSSREAEERLAVREKDWRKRKQLLDAAAAAVFLQDFLDRQPRTAGADWRRD